MIILENKNPMFCTLKCDACPAHTPQVHAPTTCLVMNAVIGAYHAQEEYWVSDEEGAELHKIRDEMKSGKKHKLDEAASAVKEGEV